MAQRWGPGVRLWATAVACLVGGFLVTGATSPVPGRDVTRVLQLNLCNSGLAGCFTGRAVDRAAVVIRAEEPDVVTLNEVCEGDVPVLERALADSGPGGATLSAFRAAGDRRTGGAVSCRNGQRYGIGIVARLRPDAGGHTGTRQLTLGGIFPMQDVGQPEQRAWLCLNPGTTFTACTTHLASSSPAVARAQCGYLLRWAVPTAHLGTAAVVLGGDLNLRFGGVPVGESCIPAGSSRVDDAGVQNVVTTSAFAIAARRFVDMDGTTDHPGLLVDLRAARSSAVGGMLASVGA
jgi:endonuclease/exonuclease/phosphatase family protein